MRILLVADEESPYIWDHFDRDRFADIDLIISCGDLKREYLDFLVTMIPVPLLYVPGNHDDDFLSNPPPGCISLEKKVYKFQGLRFVGFGGVLSPQYRPNHYSEFAMVLRILRRFFTLARGVDVLVTHAPARGLGDGKDSFHKGFVCFRRLLDITRPRYHLHGHQHLRYGSDSKRSISYGNTRIVNGCGYTILEISTADRRC